MKAFSLRCLYMMLLFLGDVFGLLFMADQGSTGGDDKLSKAILEMLHIDRFSTPYQAKPHPYMRQVYQLLNTQEARDLGILDGTLVQSFRSVEGPGFAPQGWIWFNVSHMRPSMMVAELVLLRKTLHPNPLSVTVALHSLVSRDDGVAASAPLEERLLTLDKLPPSGYDVFNVSGLLDERPLDMVGFQLRYKDESGSLVLHEALTQSLYCLKGSSLSEPLLVMYRVRSLRPQMTSESGLPLTRRQYQPCRSVNRQGRSHHGRHAPKESLCRLHHLYVDFRAGVLANWILQPSGFNASICRGTCNLGKLGTSNEDFRGQKNPKEEKSVKSSTCDPLEFSSVTVMYKTETDDILITTLRDVKAERCVCTSNTK